MYQYVVTHNNDKSNSNKNNLNLEHNLKSYLVYLQDVASPHNTIASDLNKLCGDGSAKFIYKYKCKRFQMKHIFSVRDRALSAASKQLFIVLHNLAFFILIAISVILFIYSTVISVLLSILKRPDRR